MFYYTTILSKCLCTIVNIFTKICIIVNISKAPAKHSRCFHIILLSPHSKKQDKNFIVLDIFSAHSTIILYFFHFHLNIRWIYVRITIIMNYSYLQERNPQMYIFSRTLLETLKLLCLSLTCSSVFSMMIFQEDVVSIAFVCFILNLISLVLFGLIYFRNWQKVYEKTFTSAEYWVPALTSFFIYFIFSTICYTLASNPWIIPDFAKDTVAVSNFRSFYRYMFQHTRFLEPMLNSEYAFVSYILAQILTFGVLIAVPRTMQNRN